MLKNKKIYLFFTLICFFCVACSPFSVPKEKKPKKIDNLCYVFKQYPEWVTYAKNAQKRWGVPVSVQFAIIHQESSFTQNAKPPRKTFFGIPFWRPTSAKGYAQVTDETWSWYKRNAGYFFSSRQSMGSCLDFIGFYANEAHRRAKISKRNPYLLYLAYHEGIGGFIRGTYKKKGWLIAVAKKVEHRAINYHYQLQKCRYFSK